MKLWHNIAASNNAWSSGVTPAVLAALAKEAPAVQVFDIADGSLIGATSTYEIRADGCELWALLELERVPDGAWHGESVLVQDTRDGSVKLGAVALTTKPRGWVQGWIENRHPGKVGRL